jgi:hypothetical protein
MAARQHLQRGDYALPARVRTTPFPWQTSFSRDIYKLAKPIFSSRSQHLAAHCVNEKFMTNLRFRLLAALRSHSGSISFAACATVRER